MKAAKRIDQRYLLSEFQKGQERAFDFIFRSYYKALCVQALSYVKDMDIAQDFVQDCFIKLWEKRKDATEIESISSYLFIMVRNQCIDYLRKQKKMEDIQQADIKEYYENTIESTLVSKEFEEKLILTVASLPDRCRLAFEYSRFEGLTYNNIALKMGISKKAVEALITRALVTLKNELKEYLPLLLIMIIKF
jgi:RNA polymerase sigma-70 factor (ECF subfamily)